MTTLLILLGIAAVVLFYFVGIYNKLVRKRSMMEEGWSGIDVQLKKRYNLIPNLVETVKGYATHEKETLNQVIQARNSALNAEGVKAQTSAEKNLNSALANVFALSEAYPDLKANTNFLQLQNELSSIEGDIEKARRYYNATVRDNNIAVESFPSNIVAGIGNFELGEFFEIEVETERANPEVKF
ncbi:MAG: LemA family protein [Saprospiraceae bacterium]|nr:LemA family protein [Saprospiraceae bacterium]